jgi:hypothetical protein
MLGETRATFTVTLVMPVERIHFVVTFFLPYRPGCDIRDGDIEKVSLMII